MNGNQIDVLCLLETKIPSFSSSIVLETKELQIFNNEDCYHNFNDVPNGCIWLEWNAIVTGSLALLSHPQLIHGCFSTNFARFFFVTFVYAGNSNHVRKDLWRLLLSLALSISVPWLIMGDFNCVRNPMEKMSGRVLIPSKLKDFNDYIINSGLTELQNKGPSFS